MTTDPETIKAVADEVMAHLLTVPPEMNAYLRDESGVNYDASLPYFARFDQPASMTDLRLRMQLTPTALILTFTVQGGHIVGRYVLTRPSK